VKLLKNKSAKNISLFLFGSICEWVSIKLYSIMKKCERNSKRGEEIENKVKRIQDDVAFARNAQEEIFYSRDVLSEKEIQLEACHKYIRFIAFHFRNGNYGEVDKALSELGL